MCIKRLTPGEIEAFALVVTRMLNKQIGFELGISEKLVRVHRVRVMEKMRAASVAELRQGRLSFNHAASRAPAELSTQNRLVLTYLSLAPQLHGTGCDMDRTVKTGAKAKTAQEAEAPYAALTVGRLVGRLPANRATLTVAEATTRPEATTATAAAALRLRIRHVDLAKSTTASDRQRRMIR